MFDQSNDDQLKESYTLYDGRITDFYKSTKYTNAVARYEYRRNMYYRKPPTNVPVWRSQLFFPVFYLACQGFEAQLKAKDNDPLVNIKLKTKRKKNESDIQKESVYNYDLSHDLEISDFSSDKAEMYWYLKIFGCAIGRESWVREVSVSTKREIAETPEGMEQIQETETPNVKEHTKTTVIHPLNFCHMLNRGDFKKSSWGSVRYEVDIAELVAMKQHPLAIKENIDKAIADIEDGRSGWSSDKLTFYADDQELSSGSAQYHQTIIVDEVSGDMHFKGNSSDSGLYFGIMDRKRNAWLLIGPSPFKRHPYWKMRTYPDPAGPYGVDPCGVMISINVIKNTFFNRYMDWVDSTVKFQYEVFSKNILGGANAVMNGAPGGFIEPIDDATWKTGQPLIRPVNKDKSGIPGMNDVLSYIEKAEVQSSIVSDQRNKVKGNETATQSMEIAKKGDDSISSVLEDIDRGLKDCMQLKVANRIRFSTKPVDAYIGGDDMSPPVRYYPFELSEDDLDIQIDRIDGSAEANKALAFVGKVNEAMQMIGSSLDPMGVIAIYRRIGRDIGMGEEIEDLLQPIQQQQPIMPGQVPGAVPPGVVPAMPQSQQPQQSPEAANASALA
jgi:hypothetical protein